MSTETATRFRGKQRPDVPDKNHSSVGPKEESGFVENYQYGDAITAYPGERWNNMYRPIDISVYQNKYVPFAFAKVKYYEQLIVEVNSLLDNILIFRANHNFQISVIYQ